MAIDYKQDYLKMPGSFHDRINETLIHLPDREESEIMKTNHKPTWKKTVVIAAAAVAVLTTTVFAGGKISGYFGSTSNKVVYTSAPSAEQVQKDYKFAPNIPEAFSNGYTFNKAYAGTKSAIDEAGNEIERVNELSIDYNKGVGELSLDTCAHIDCAMTDQEGGQPIQIGGTTAYYSETIIKTVPDGYVLTEQDKADEAAGKYVFSYADEDATVTVETVKSLIWTSGDVDYVLMAEDTDLVQEDFVGMAEEII